MTVGFVGLGNIGRPMAKRLDAPVVFDVRPEATDGFDDVAGSASDLASRCDVISVMVRDDAQTREVVADLVNAAKPDTVIALHSTISPGLAEELAATYQEVAIVDAPVSGGAIGAHEGTLVVMLGAPDDAAARATEAFAPWSSVVVRTGPVGSATKMKIARNLITFVSFSAAAEAQRIAEAAGLDLRALGDVVRASDKVTGGPGAIMIRDTTAPLAPDDGLRDIFSHTRDLGEKDLDLALELAASIGVDVPLTRAAREHLSTALGVPHD